MGVTIFDDELNWIPVDHVCESPAETSCYRLPPASRGLCGMPFRCYFRLNGGYRSVVSRNA